MGAASKKKFIWVIRWAELKNIHTGKCAGQGINRFGTCKKLTMESLGIQSLLPHL